MDSNNIEEYKSFNEVDWQHIDHFVNNEGLRIFCRYWKPTGEVKAIVFISHGVAEHSRWYAPLAHLLNEKGFLVCAHDHVGHGLSEGDRVHINQFSTYTSDLLQHVNIITTKYQDLPVFLIGHSMGGTISVMSGLDNPDVFQGIVLIAPAIQPDPQSATWIKVAAAKFLAKLCPQAHVGGLNTEWLCRDLNIVKAYENDPLNYHGGMKANWAVCMLNTFTKIESRQQEVKWPLLLIHGDSDKICQTEASQSFYDAVKSEDKTIKIYPGCYHQVHNEPDGMGEECKQLIVEWIADRCQ